MMLKLSKQAIDTYSLGVSAFQNNTLFDNDSAQAGTPPTPSRRLLPVSLSFTGAHNQGLARSPVGAAANGGISICVAA